MRVLFLKLGSPSFSSEERKLFSCLSSQHCKLFLTFPHRSAISCRAQDISFPSYLCPFLGHRVEVSSRPCPSVPFTSILACCPHCSQTGMLEQSALLCFGGCPAVTPSLVWAALHLGSHQGPGRDGGLGVETVDLTSSWEWVPGCLLYGHVKAEQASLIPSSFIHSLTTSAVDTQDD